MAPSLPPPHSGAAWHRYRIPALGGRLLLWMGGREPRDLLAPQLRGHVEPRVVDALERRGWHVHRIGAAAYVHGDDLHLIWGVWRRREPAPAWAGRLGAVSEGYLRRLERLAREQRARLFLRDGLGRFVARLPWWRVPPPRAYSFEPARLAPLEEERIRAERRNQAVRIHRGLALDPSELELRALWGDR